MQGLIGGCLGRPTRRYSARPHPYILHTYLLDYATVCSSQYENSNPGCHAYLFHLPHPACNHNIDLPVSPLTLARTVQIKAMWLCCCQSEQDRAKSRDLERVEVLLSRGPSVTVSSDQDETLPLPLDSDSTQSPLEKDQGSLELCAVPTMGSPAESLASYPNSARSGFGSSSWSSEALSPQQLNLYTRSDDFDVDFLLRAEV